MPKPITDLGFLTAKRTHMWAAFSGRQMIWPSIRGTRHEVRNDFREQIERSHYEIRRVTVVEGKW